MVSLVWLWLVVLPMDQPATSQPDTSKQALFRWAAITHYGEPYTSLPDKIQYLAFAEETCPTTEKIHYQTRAYAKVTMKLTSHSLGRAVRVARRRAESCCSSRSSPCHSSEAPSSRSARRRAAV
jgi:hypothetical protein